MRIVDWSSDVCSSDLLTDERDMVHIGAAVGPLIGARQRRGRVALMKPLARDRRVVEIVGQGGKPRRGFGPVVERRLKRRRDRRGFRSEEHTSELQSLMRISYAVFCLKTTRYETNTQNN